MSEKCVDICVIGAGAAGLTTAAVAAQLGARTVLIERGRDGRRMPQYRLRAVEGAARRGKGGACRARPPAASGWTARRPRSISPRFAGTCGASMDAIAPHDSVERFEGLGVEVVRAEARFVGPREIGAGNRTIRARRVVIATGSEPAIPPIPGHRLRALFDERDDFRQRPRCRGTWSSSAPARSASSWRRPIAGSAPPSRWSRVPRALPRDDPELAAMLLPRLCRRRVSRSTNGPTSNRSSRRGPASRSI